MTLEATPPDRNNSHAGTPLTYFGSEGGRRACRGRVLRSRGKKNFWTLRANRGVIYTEQGVLARFGAFSSSVLDPKIPCPGLYPRFWGVVSEVLQLCISPRAPFLGVRHSTTTPCPPAQGVEKMERSGDFGPPTAQGFSSGRLFVTRSRKRWEQK